MLFQNLPISSIQEIMDLLDPVFKELYRLFRIVYYWMGFDAESFTVFAYVSTFENLWIPAQMFQHGETI
jgi:hypothetical protein